MYCRIVPNKATVLVEAALGKACDKDTSVTAWDISNADTHLLISVFSVHSGVCAMHTVMQQGSRYASMLVRSMQAVYSQAWAARTHRKVQNRKHHLAGVSWPSFCCDRVVVELHSQGGKEQFPESLLPFLGLSVWTAEPSPGRFPDPASVSLEVLASPHLQTGGG